MQNLTYENEFDLHENKRIGARNIFLYECSFARRLVLKQRQKEGNLNMKGVGILCVLLRGINSGFWSHLGCFLGKSYHM